MSFAGPFPADHRPLSTIRDTLVRPDGERHLDKSKVSSLLKHNLERFDKPWEPFQSQSSSSASTLSKPTVTVPGTELTLEVDPASKAFAERLVKETGIDELTALMFWKSYALHSLEEVEPQPGQSEEDAVFERLLLWYEQQLLAVPQIIMALYAPAANPKGYEEVAEEMRKDILGDQSQFIEKTFRAFSQLAQKPIDPRSPRPLFW